MSLSLSTAANAIGSDLWGYSPVIDFSAYASGAEAIAFDFQSPNSYYRCLINVSLDTGSWAANDIIAIIVRGNGLILFKSKWAVNATTLGQPIEFPYHFVLPPNTQFKVVLAMSSGTAMVGTGSVIMTGRKIGEAFA
ncbi:MAG TPA: hypothetical protein EYG65_00630 [Rhodospirillales bacterium]|nr:hypothetical protein [Rhodospirillales bacterium]